MIGLGLTDSRPPAAGGGGGTFSLVLTAGQDPTPFFKGYSDSIPFGSLSTTDWFGEGVGIVAFLTAFNTQNLTIQLDATPANTGDVVVLLEGASPITLSWATDRFLTADDLGLFDYITDGQTYNVTIYYA